MSSEATAPERSVRAKTPPAAAEPSTEPGRHVLVLATLIIAAAKSAFPQGDEWAYLAGIVAILVGAALVFFLFPKWERERMLLPW